MARKNAVQNKNPLNGLGRAWLAERGDREALRVRYPWGFDGPQRTLPSELDAPAPLEGAGEIVSLGQGSLLDELTGEDTSLDFTFSDDWAV